MLLSLVLIQKLIELSWEFMQHPPSPQIYHLMVFACLKNSKRWQALRERFHYYAVKESKQSYQHWVLVSKAQFPKVLRNLFCAQFIHIQMIVEVILENLKISAVFFTFYQFFHKSHLVTTSNYLLIFKGFFIHAEKFLGRRTSVSKSIRSSFFLILSVCPSFVQKSSLFNFRDVFGDNADS